MLGSTTAHSGEFLVIRSQSVKCIANGNVYNSDTHIHCTCSIIVSCLLAEYNASACMHL